MRGTLKQDHTVTLWNCTFTLPKGTTMQLIKGASGTKGDQWAVESEKLLIDLTGNSHDPKYRYCFVDAELIDIGNDDVAIWSKFGLYRMASRAELSGIVDASPEEITADLESKGFCLTFCDVERVAILRDYPSGKEPDEVLAWVNEGKEVDITYSATLEHSQHTLADWRYEVRNGDTTRGYDEWVKAQIEAEAGDN